MENYDEKMNYSFEPAPEAPSRPPLEQAKEDWRMQRMKLPVHDDGEFVPLHAEPTLNAPVLSRCSPPTTEMASGTSWLASARRRAVTTISSSG